MKLIKSSETDFIKTTKYEGYGYEIRLYQMKEADLKDTIAVKPLEIGRPEIFPMGDNDFGISFSGSYMMEEIPQIHQYLQEAETLIGELKAIQNREGKIIILPKEDYDTEGKIHG